MREPRTWHDDYWHPDAPDTEAPGPWTVRDVASVLVMVAMGWLAFLGFVDLVVGLAK